MNKAARSAFRSACLFAFLIAALAGTMPAAAQQQVYRRGADLHEALQQDGPAASAALNYIVGAVDAQNGRPAADGECFDLKGEAVPASRIVQVVRAFLLKNVPSKERAGSSVVAAALAEVWPCR